MTNNFKANKGSYNQPQLSKEEWAAKKKGEKEVLYKLIDDTALEVASSPEKFKNFLDTQSRMDRYSVANNLTLLNYCPHASKLREFDEWASDGAKIIKGKKTIPILEPYEYTKNDGTPGIDYNIKKMFDVSQTTAKQTPAPTVNRDPQKLVAIMLDMAPVNVETVGELPFQDMGAMYNDDKQTLFIKKGIGDSVALCQCVAQELGHAQLAINSDAYSRKDMGFNAVCIGYMLCKKYGVDTQNFNIANLDGFKGKTPKEVRGELSKIRTAMKEIHSRVSDEIYRKSQERTKDHDAR